MTTNTTLAGPLTLLQATAVAQWYDELAPALRRFVAGVLLRTMDDAPDVDDVLQETFIRLMAHMREFAALETAEHRRNYAFLTAKWAARDRYRLQQRRIDARPLSAVDDLDHEPVTAVTASHDWQTHAEGIEQTTAARMTLWAIWEATPHEYRELLPLLATGYNRAEMAALLHISLHAVDMRVWRLRQMLRQAGGQLS